MDMSWGALTATFIFITPALLGLMVLRMFFPKLQTIFKNDFILVLSCSFLSVVLNWNLLADYFSKIATKFKGNSKEVLETMFPALEFGQLTEPFRPFSSLFGITDNNSVSLFLLAGDIHVRVLAYSILAYIVFKAIPATWEAHLKNMIFHPWALLMERTSDEVLMADVLTEEDSMYSGAITSWIPDGDGISSVALKYVLRYMPDENSTRRKRAFIKNSGELVISKSEIRTVHLWKIKKGYTHELSVKNRDGLEEAKRWLLMAKDFEDIIKRVSIVFEPESKLTPMNLLKFFDMYDFGDTRKNIEFVYYQDKKER